MIKMKYAIVQRYVDSKHEVIIDEEQYNKIKKAHRIMSELFLLEQKYDVLLENYNELEMEILNISMRTIMFNEFNYEFTQKDSNKINRRILNLLSSCKMYLDHCAHHASRISSSDKEKFEMFKKIISKEYDNVLGYRVMEALRNYVQHRGFPVHSLTYKFNNVTKEEKIIKRVLLSPIIDLTKIEEDGKFKKQVLNELKEIDLKHDLRTFIREYLNSISKIHNFIKDLFKEVTTEMEDIFVKSENVYKLGLSGSKRITGLAAVKIQDNASYADEIPIFLKMIDYRKELENKNCKQSDLNISYVSSESN